MPPKKNANKKEKDEVRKPAAKKSSSSKTSPHSTTYEADVNSADINSLLEGSLGDQSTLKNYSETHLELILALESKSFELSDKIPTTYNKQTCKSVPHTVFQYPTAGALVPLPATSPRKPLLPSKRSYASRAVSSISVQDDPFSKFIPTALNSGPVSNKSSLADLGISIATKRNKGRSGGTIQFALIDGPSKYVLFVFLPAGNWAEKLYYDGHKQDLPYARHTEIFKFHVNNELVTNNGGYPVRLYGIPVVDLPDDDKLRAMAGYILAGVKSMDNKTESFFDETKKYITGERIACWSEVAGIEFAMQHLILEAKEGPNPEFYSKHTALVCAHFRSGRFYPSFAEAIGAPIEEVDPSLLRNRGHADNRNFNFPENLQGEYGNVQVDYGNVQGNYGNIQGDYGNVRNV